MGRGSRLMRLLMLRLGTRLTRLLMLRLGTRLTRLLMLRLGLRLRLCAPLYSLTLTSSLRQWRCLMLQPCVLLRLVVAPSLNLRRCPLLRRLRLVLRRGLARSLDLGFRLHLRFWLRLH